MVDATILSRPRAILKGLLLNAQSPPGDEPARESR